MHRLLPLSIIFLLFTVSRLQAQTFTFQCVCDYVTAADSNCDICNSQVQSRLFCGLLVKKNGVAYKWIDQPYIVKQQGQNVVITEIIPNAETITIARTGTAFGTMDSLKMAVDCPCNSFKDPLFWNSDSTNVGPVYFGDTMFIVGRGIVSVQYDSLLRKYVIDADTTGLGGGGGGTGTVINVAATAPAAGFTISGSPITVSGTFVFTLANDLAGVEGLTGTGIASRTGTDTWALRTITAGTGSITVNNGDGVGGNPTINNTDPDQSTTNELQTYSHSGTTSYTNTLSNGGGSFTIQGGTGITVSHTTGTVTLATTITQYTDEQAQDAVGNILTDSGTIDFTYNDAGNTITAIVIDNSISDSKIRQSAGLSVIGRSATTTGNVADITGTTDQVLRVNTAGTSLGFGTVATGGITNQAVTYAKIQNMATNRFLGRITAGSGSPEELTGTQATTLLDVFTSTLKGLAPASGGGTTNFLRADGTWAAPTISLSGTANRFALWTATNTLGDDAAFTFDGANDRATFTGSVAGTGANNAFLNLNGGSITGTVEALRASVNASTSLDLVVANARNVSNTGNAKIEAQVGGTSAGDAFFMTSILGGNFAVFGIDNSDADKWKLSFNPTGSVPGGTANKGLIMTADATPLFGINLDAPVEEMDVAGEVRARHLLNTGNLWNNGLCAFGAGAGTAPTINGLTGGNNFFLFEFTTGTLPVNNGIIATLTFPNAYPVGPTYTVFSARNNQTATDIAKFYVSTSSDTAITFQANGTLNASTAYKFIFITGGRE